MWWQVKRTRILGGGVLVASILFSVFMFYAMHDNLTEGSSRRGGGGGGHGGSANISIPDSELLVLNQIKDQ